jgi:hypothetical protein
VCNPLTKGGAQRNITPTELDFFYRESQVHGRVHDEAPAVIGGQPAVNGAAYDDPENSS